MENISTTSPCIKGNEVKILFYADDVVLTSKSVGGMRRSLRALEEYCEKWKLSVNARKTKMMIVSNGRKRGANEVWMYKEQTIENVRNFEYLGVVLSGNGSWNEHVERMVEKAKITIMYIRRYVYKYENFPVNVIVKMCNALVLPILTYGSEVWTINCINYSKQFKKINVVLHNFYKEILCVSKSTPNSAVSLELGVMNVEYLCIKKAINYRNRIINSNKRLQIKCINERTMSVLSELLNERGLNGLNEMNDKASVKRVVNQIALTANLEDIRTKESLSMFAMLDHYLQGARYLSISERNERYVIASFRMYSFRWNSVKVNGVRVCVMCDAAESVRHLIEDCPGVEGEEKQNINKIKMNTAEAVLNVFEPEKIKPVVAYLRFILNKRNSYIH